MRPLIPALALALAATTPAMAETNCYVPYTQFEALVPHLDLAHCPDKSLAEDGFCRLGLEGNRVHVYKFRFTRSDACLEAVETYDFQTFVERFGASYGSE